MFSDTDLEPAASLARKLITVAPEASDPLITRFIRAAPWSKDSLPSRKELEKIVRSERGKLLDEWTDEHKSPEVTAALSKAKEAWGTRYLAAYRAKHGVFPTYADTTAECSKVFGSGINNSKIKKFRGLAEDLLAETDGEVPNLENTFQAAVKVLKAKGEKPVVESEDEFFTDLVDSAEAAAKAFKEAEAEAEPSEPWYVKHGYSKATVQKRIEEAKRVFYKLKPEHQMKISSWLARATDPETVLRAPNRKLRRALSGFKGNPLGFATLALLACPKIYPFEIARCYEVFDRQKFDTTVVRIAAFEMGAPYDSLVEAIPQETEEQENNDAARGVPPGKGVLSAAFLGESQVQQAKGNLETDVPVLLHPNGRAVVVVPDEMFERLAEIQSEQINLAVDRAVGSLARSFQTEQNTRVEKKLDRLTALLGGLESRLTDMPSTDNIEEKVANLSGKMSALENTVEQSKAETQNSMDRLRTRVASSFEAIEEKVNPLSARLDALHTRMGDLFNTLGVLEQRVAAIDNAVGESGFNKAAVVQIQALRNDIASSQNEMTSQTAALRSEIAAAVGKVGLLADELAEIKSNPVQVEQVQNKELTLSELVMRGFEVEVQPKKPGPTA